MNVTINMGDGESVIVLEGNLTIDSVAAAKQKIVAAVVDARSSRFDLSAVRECDTAGVQLILMARVDARARGLTFSVSDQSAVFGSAAERIGIPANIFAFQSNGVADRA